MSRPDLPLEVQLDLAGVDAVERHTVLTFAEFLADSGAAGVGPVVRDADDRPRPGHGQQTPAGRRWWATWGPYVRGEYPGPLDPEP